MHHTGKVEYGSRIRIEAAEAIALPYFVIDWFSKTSTMDTLIASASAFKKASTEYLAHVLSEVLDFWKSNTHHEERKVLPCFVVMRADIHTS